MSTFVGLVRATHFPPTLAVTTVATLLAIGTDHPRPWLITLAVLAGQASIGWSNDAIDASRDVQNQRVEKPVVQGHVSSRTLRGLAAMALVLTVPLSFAAAGLGGGLAHIAAVLSAWMYNLGLKATPLSFLPYAISFSLLPFVVGVAHWWVVVVFAIFGVGAHIANGVLDIDKDKKSKINNITVVLGKKSSELLAVSLLLIATALLTVNIHSAVLFAIFIIQVVVIVLMWRKLFAATLIIAVMNAAAAVRYAPDLFG